MIDGMSMFRKKVVNVFTIKTVIIRLTSKGRELEVFEKISREKQYLQPNMLFFHTLIRSCDAVETPACQQSLFAEQKFLSLSQEIILNEI